MLQFQMPNITREQLAGNRARFEVEPLDRGFGHTFGNALRRVLLSSLEGAAVSSVKIEGVAHEFTTIKGVKEDVTDVILNLKELVCRLHGELDEVQVRLYKDKPGKVVAADIDIPAELEILNPDHHIATLSDVGPEHEALLGRMLALAPRLMRELGVVNGFRTVINTGRDGGQEVQHLHMHVMGGPRPWLKG